MTKSKSRASRKSGKRAASEKPMPMTRAFDLISGLPDDVVRSAKDKRPPQKRKGAHDELAQLRKMLDRRYDEIKSGTVKPIDGEEAFEKLKRKTESRRG